MALAETITDDFTSQGAWQTYGTAPTWNSPGLFVNCNVSGCFGGHALADIQGSYFRVQVTDISVTGSKGAFFYIADQTDGYRMYWTLEGAAQEVRVGIRNASVDVGYNLNRITFAEFPEGSWLGFSATPDGSTLQWDYSLDGIDWITLHSTPNPWGFPPSAMTDAYYGEGGGSATFANLNLLPAGSPSLPPANTAVPTITGTHAVDATITGHLGDWDHEPTSFAYRFAYEPNYGGTDGISTDYTLARPVPGTAGTTTDPAHTVSYTLNRGDTGRNIFFEVTASNANGDVVAKSADIIIHTTQPPFKKAGNPWITPLPDDAPVDPDLTATLQAQLQTWHDARVAASQIVWYPQGGDYGDSWSSYLHEVNNSMTRQPIILIGIDSNDVATGLTNPRYPPVMDSENPKEHLAWCLSERDGGIPMPPSGLFYVGGNDMHTAIYNVDTGTFIDTWITLFVPDAPTFDWGGTTVTPHDDYKGHIVCMYGGYIRDVRQNKGYWGGYWDDHQVGSWNVPYILDKDGHREYSSWGAMATGIPYYGTPTILESELLAGEIPHAIGLITPGSNSTHNFPATRHDVGAGSNLPQGGIWRLDPSIDVDALPTLGHPDADQMRSMLFKAFQRFGAIPIDSTGQGLAFRFESVNGVWPNIPNVFSTTTVDYDAMFASVPYTAWSYIDPAYRPVLAGDVLSGTSDVLADASDVFSGGSDTVTGGSDVLS